MTCNQAAFAKHGAAGALLFVGFQCDLKMFGVVGCCYFAPWIFRIVGIRTISHGCAAFSLNRPTRSLLFIRPRVFMARVSIPIKCTPSETPILFQMFTKNGSVH